MRVVGKFITEKSIAGIALALGYFDSVHLGHCSLISECTSSEYSPAVFTFRNNPDLLFSGNNKQCFTYSERVSIFERLGVELVISSDFNVRIMNMSGYDFLSMIYDNNNIKLIVIGSDYCCGHNAEYKTADIIKFFSERGVNVIVKDLIQNDGMKIASRNIRSMLADGKISEVNRLLPFPFQINGTVTKGRSVGGSIVGYPTANIAYPVDKIELKAGVYKTNIDINGRSYIALTNVGAHPTFDDYVFNIESFVIDYDGDLYGQDISVQFIEYLRGIIKFDNATQLHAQITADFERVMQVK